MAFEFERDIETPLYNSLVDLLGLNQNLLALVEKLTKKSLLSGSGATALCDYEERCLRNNTKPDEFAIICYMMELSDRCYATDQNGKFINTNLRTMEQLTTILMTREHAIIKANFADGSYYERHVDISTKGSELDE